jgi:adenylate/nucleoside-diphosphate kinase
MVVRYGDKIYAMANASQKEKFKRKPLRYDNLVLPAKLPPKISPLNVAELPMLGYLEQTFSRELTEALKNVGEIKPKHPHKSTNRSACEYLGLYLKGIIHGNTS